MGQFLKLYLCVSNTHFTKKKHLKGRFSNYYFLAIRKCIFGTTKFQTSHKKMSILRFSIEDCANFLSLCLQNKKQKFRNTFRKTFRNYNNIPVASIISFLFYLMQYLDFLLTKYQCSQHINVFYF